MSKTTIRLLAWTLLLGSAILSIVAGINLGENESTEKLLIRSRDPGPIANWVFFFITISIGICVYLLRGIDGGGWRVSFIGIVAIFGVAILLLLFGIDGLLIMGMAALAATPFFIRRKPDDKKI